MLKQYRERLGEFEKAMKVTRQNEKRVNKDLNAYKKRRSGLEDNQLKLCKQIGLGDPSDIVGMAEAISKIEDMQSKWDAEKEDIMKDIEDVKAVCAGLQEQIAKKKSEKQ